MELAETARMKEMLIAGLLMLTSASAFAQQTTALRRLTSAVPTAR
jgi:hypothetical protein